MLLATFFLGAAYLHSVVPIQTAAEQAPWIADVPVALARFIGIGELAGALGLVLPAAFRVAPQLTVAAAIGLAVIMVLAAPFHVARGEASMIGMPAGVASVLAVIAWGRLRRVPIPPRQTRAQVSEGRHA